VIFIIMGRIKINPDKKKVRVTITIDPKIEKIARENFINLSSLANNLLLNHFNNEKFTN
jgi:hypothetical protein